MDLSLRTDNSLLIIQPFVAAITLINFAPRCPVTSEKSEVKTYCLLKRIGKKTEIRKGVVTVKKQLEIDN